MNDSNSIWNKAMLAVLLMIVIVSVVACDSGTVVPEQDDVKIKHFTNLEELKEFVGKQENYDRYYGVEMMESVTMKADTATAAAGAGADDYSTTNIQVAGVDEADFIKNDGKYIYMINNGNGQKQTVQIIDAYPAEEAEIIAEISPGFQASQLYLNEDRLIVIGSNYLEVDIEMDEDVNEGIMAESMPPRHYSKPITVVAIYDIEDREDPELVDTVEFEGNYINSRMIGDYVYPIVQEYIRGEPYLPVYRVGGQEKMIFASDIGYVDWPDYGYSYTHIAAINVNDIDVEDKVYILGQSMNMYVSQDNIYLTHYKRVNTQANEIEIIKEALLEVLPRNVARDIRDIFEEEEGEVAIMEKLSEAMNKFMEGMDEEERKKFEEDVQEAEGRIEMELVKKSERTFIHRISIDEGDISYEASGSVPGHVLNQFSMDEYEGNFRIATTTGNVARFSNQASSANHIYVLDEDLDIIGSVEDLAPGEKIYSARFMGEKGYLVTFRKVDPLFVIDLSDPRDPEVLGKLKIPGYSDYLHPYDENHLIGIGKQTVGAKEGDFSWYQGVKVSLFDVTDVENPKEVGFFEIGDRGTHSEALNDHKAVLFDKEKNLLVIPVQVNEIDQSKYEGEIPGNAYGDYKWQGAVALRISPEKGVQLSKEIIHHRADEDEDRGYYGYGSTVRRSLYMDDILYTVSSSKIKMNDMKDDFKEVNELVLEEDNIEYPSYEIGLK